MLLCFHPEVHLAKKETLCQFLPFREERQSVILGSMLTVANLVKVNYDFTNWKLEIDLCFFISEINPISCHCRPANKFKQGKEVGCLRLLSGKVV